MRLARKSRGSRSPRVTAARQDGAFPKMQQARRMSLRLSGLRPEPAGRCPPSLGRALHWSALGPGEDLRGGLYLRSVTIAHAPATAAEATPPAPRPDHGIPSGRATALPTATPYDPPPGSPSPDCCPRTQTPAAAPAGSR